MGKKACWIIGGFEICCNVTHSSMVLLFIIGVHCTFVSTFQDECSLFISSVLRRETPFKAHCGPFEVSSPEVNSGGIDSNQTALREYWCLSESRAVKGLVMRQEPFERFLWWAAPSEKFYPALHFTALHYTLALAPYHILPPSSLFICRGIPIRLMPKRPE